MTRRLLIVAAFLSFLPTLASALPDGFVDLSEVAPGIRLELRYHGKDNFVGEPINGYESARCIMTRPTAEALVKVHADLEEFGLGIKVFDAYRPQRAVDHFVRWAWDAQDTKTKDRYYPNVKKDELIKKGYIAPKSGHTRGSAVDVTIVSLETGKELDMGTPWDRFGPESWPTSRDVGMTQRAHRMLLQMVMVRHGFLPLKEEWWHFALKDEPFPETYFNFPIR